MLWHSDLNKSIPTKTIYVKPTQFFGLRPSSKGNENGVRERGRLIHNAFYFVLRQQANHKNNINNQAHKNHINLHKQLYDTLLTRRNKSEDKKRGSAEFKRKIIPGLVSCL